MENKQNIEETARLYTSAWNESEPEKIRAIIAKCWAPEATYIDRQTPSTDFEEITSLILKSHAAVPGRTFTMLDAPDAHNNSGRLRWQINFADGYPKEGMDYFEFNDDNLITRIVGFIPGS